MRIEDLWNVAEECLKRPDSLISECAAQLEHLSAELVGAPGINTDDRYEVDRSIGQLKDLWLALRNDALARRDLSEAVSLSLYRASANIQTLANRVLFGARLREYRRRRRAKTADVAAEAGIDRSYLWKLENGAAGPPDPEVIAKLSRALGVHIADLAEEAIGPLSYLVATEVHSAGGARTTVISDIVKACKLVPIDQLRVLPAQVRAISEVCEQQRNARPQKKALEKQG